MCFQLARNERTFPLCFVILAVMLEYVYSQALVIEQHFVFVCLSVLLRACFNLML